MSYILLLYRPLGYPRGKSEGGRLLMNQGPAHGNRRSGRSDYKEEISHAAVCGIQYANPVES